MPPIPSAYDHLPDYRVLEYAPVDEHVYVLGPRLPPIGGISVHVERRAAMLRHHGQRFTVVDQSRMSVWSLLAWLLRIVGSPRRAVFEVNEFYGWQFLALCLRPFPRHIVLRVHGAETLPALRGLHRLLLKWFLRRVDTCTLDGKHLADRFRQEGLTLPPHTVVGHAFLPPDVSEEAAIWATYEDEIKTFLQRRDPVLLVYASTLEFLNGVEVYGIDLAIDMLAKIVETHPNAGLIIGLPSKEEGPYLDALRARLSKAGLDAQVYFKRGGQPLWPLFHRVDVYLRPTSTDGDAVAVREALFLGCAVAASDVCPRPEGTELFTSRDAQDGARAVCALLDTRRALSIHPLASTLEEGR